MVDRGRTALVPVRLFRKKRKDKRIAFSPGDGFVNWISPRHVKYAEVEQVLLRTPVWSGDFPGTTASVLALFGPDAPILYVGFTRDEAWRGAKRVARVVSSARGRRPSARGRKASPGTGRSPGD